MKQQLARFEGPPPVERPQVVLAALACLTAAWIAAGSTGAMGHALRHILTWFSMGVALVACWPGWCSVRPRTSSLGPRTPRTSSLGPPASSAGSLAATGRRLGLLALAAGAVVVTTQSLLLPINVLAVAFVTLLLAAGRSDAVAGRILTATGTAIAIFGLYRFAGLAITPVWLFTDGIGAMLSGALTAVGKPLWVGATYGGLDFLVLVAALLLVSLLLLPNNGLFRVAVSLPAIGLGHLAYLLLLTGSARVASWLPEAPTLPESAFGQMPPWSWSEALRQMLPWNMPLLAGLVHLVTAGFILRWSLASGAGDAPHGAPARPTAPDPTQAMVTKLVWACAVVLAAVLPAVTSLSGGTHSLEGKKVVAYEKGFLNWLKPTHGDYGRLSIGMYGMLPQYVEALGGQCLISPELSEEDLKGADVLILLYPNEPWEKGVPGTDGQPGTKGQLERIWDFVKDGGSLLVMGEHSIAEEDGGARFNDVLEPTPIQVRFDSAMFLIGGWLQSYEARLHPITAGIPDDRNQLGVVIGASLETRWPAQPLIVGRWGYNDPGDMNNPPSLMGNHEYDPGDQLGDVVLAAETQLGKGKIVVFGDTSTMTNGVGQGAYVFSSRLLAYLAGSSGSPQVLWRGLLGLVMTAGLLACLLILPDGRRVAVVAMVLAGSLSACAHANRSSFDVLPDGRHSKPNGLAYIDSAHLGANSDESWRDDGLAGVSMALMRSGYLVFNAPDLTQERLERAGLLVSVGAGRHYSRAERKAIRSFIENGGTYICTVGFEEPQRKGSLALMAEYGFHVGDQPPDASGYIPEPEPLGHFKSPYFNAGDYMAFVRFWAAWPILTTEKPGTEAMAYGRGDRNVILTRAIGRGRIVFVGDTCFAMNKNLERIDGQPFEGLRENADFWRWLVTFVNRQPTWQPPDPNAPPPLLPLPFEELPPPPPPPPDDLPATEPAAEEGQP